MLEVPFHLASQRQATELIPPGSATFHLLLAIHIAAALTSVATGATAALSPKRPGPPPPPRHPLLPLPDGGGRLRGLAGRLRWPQDASLLVLGTLAFAAATLGRTARRRRWRWQRWRWIGLHLVGMSASYLLLLTAFYVDNGKHLPIWQRLPHLAYWLLPSAVGLPLVARALAATTAWRPVDPPPPRLSCL